MRFHSRPTQRQSTQSNAASNASVKLPCNLGSLAEEVCPEIEWPALRAVGNILRHEYERIEVTRIWLMVENDLRPLKASVTSALGRIARSPHRQSTP
jgi:hypothetical protein